MDAAAREMTAEVPGAPAAAPRFGAYLFLHGAWFLIFGLQMVLFPYLVRVELGMGEAALGIAQMCINLPTTFLLLFGGLVADRVHPGRQILALYLIASLPFLVLASLMGLGLLSYGVLLAYALAIGTLSAFAMPARDALLSDVAPEGALGRAVTLAGLAQFGGQLAGMALATMTALVGVTSLLFTQASLMLLAAGASLFLRPRPRARRARPLGTSPIAYVASEIRGGIQAVAQSPVMAPISLLSLAIGVAFMGSFMVLLPLIVQSYFPPDLPRAERGTIATALGLFSLCFWAGTILTSILLLRLGLPRRRGSALLAALSIGALVLLSFSVQMPFAALCALNAVWGIAGGIAMTVSRALVQEAAPESHRARILSVYSLGFIGGAPIGALACGFLAEWVGPHLAVIGPGSVMLAMVAFTVMSGRLQAIDRFGRAGEG